MSYVFYIENKCQTTQVTMTFHIEIILFCSLCCAAYVVQPMLYSLCQKPPVYSFYCRSYVGAAYVELYIGCTYIGCTYIGCKTFSHRLRYIGDTYVSAAYVSATYVVQPMQSTTQTAQHRLKKISHRLRLHRETYIEILQPMLCSLCRFSLCQNDLTSM